MKTIKFRPEQDVLAFKSASDIKAELERRLTYFYGKTDGSYELPSSLEGDCLRMTLSLLLAMKHEQL